MLRRILILLLLLFPGVTRERQAPHEAIRAAAFAGGRIWLLDAEGALSSLADGELSRRPEAPGDRVLDLCAQHGQPVVLTGRADGPTWKARRLQDGIWVEGRVIARSHDTPLALSCGNTGGVVVTSRRLIELDGAASPVTLSEPLWAPLTHVVVHVTPDAAYVGIDRGEWGGGLGRIDRRTGELRTIARNATGGLCDGPLNTACDPVNGIATIPWRPTCIAVAIGLIHGDSHGRIASVCPEGIEQMFVTRDRMNLGNPRDAAEVAKGGADSLAFYGVASTRDGLLAVGTDGLYRIDARGVGTRQTWPRFTEVDGVLVSFALPDVVLVMSGGDGHRTRSGALIAVR